MSAVRCPTCGGWADHGGCARDDCVMHPATAVENARLAMEARLEPSPAEEVENGPAHTDGRPPSNRIHGHDGELLGNYTRWNGGFWGIVRAQTSHAVSEALEPMAEVRYNHWSDVRRNARRLWREARDARPSAEAENGGIDLKKVDELARPFREELAKEAETGPAEFIADPPGTPAMPPLVSDPPGAFDTPQGPMPVNALTFNSLVNRVIELEREAHERKQGFTPTAEGDPLLKAWIDRALEAEELGRRLKGQIDALVRSVGHYRARQVDAETELEKLKGEKIHGDKSDDVW